MRLIRFLGCVCVLAAIDAAPSFNRRRDTNGQSIYDNSLFYSLFLRLLSNGDLKTWINQHVLKQGGNSGGLSFGSQTGGGQQNSQSKQTTQTSTRVQSTTLPNLTIERDHDSRVTMKTGSPSVSDLTTQRDHLLQTTPSTLKQTTTDSNNKYTIPVIILTDPVIDKIVDPSSTTRENLTIIRDYPVSGPTTTDNQPPQPARNKRSIVIPILSLNSEAQYNNPGNGPKPIGLTDKTDQDLVIVRDTDNSGTHSHVVNDKQTDSTTTQSKRRRVVVAVCDHDKTRMCFKI